MKEWRKPEIVDLDVKFTEFLSINPSGEDACTCPQKPMPNGKHIGNCPLRDK